MAAFACAQFFPATSSSFTDSTSNSGNSVTAKADWTAPSVSGVVLQKSEGGVVNKLKPSGTFYVYASVADTGNPAAGIGTITASTANIATVSSATLSAGSWTVGGTTYNYRTDQLTAKATLITGTYSYSLSVSDSASNGPTTSNGSASASTAVFAPSSVLTTNVVTAGKPQATDKIAFTYSSAPDPESIFPGWDGSSRTVDVILADKSVYSTASDIFAITDSAGGTTSLGYVLMGGDYISAGKSVNWAGSTIALSGSTYTVTLGTPDVAGNLKTDTGNRVASWYSYSTAFDTFGTASTALTVSTTARVQF